MVCVNHRVDIGEQATCHEQGRYNFYQLKKIGLFKLPKTGKRIEKIGKVWDHVTNRYVLGFKLLVMMGGSLVAALWASIGKNENSEIG